MLSIDAQGWLDWSARDPGPPEKQYFDRATGQPLVNAAAVYIPHSAVGDNYSAWRDGRLWNMQRDAQGNFTPQGRASVHGWIYKNGHVIQHYPFHVTCWSSGSFPINIRAVAFENQGGADTPATVSEPLTPAQTDANVRIIRELAAAKGWTPRRPVNAADMTATLTEHRECVRFGSAPTACPSGRIPWTTILKELTAMPDLTRDEAINIIRAQQGHLKTLWRYVFVAKGWTLPPELA